MLTTVIARFKRFIRRVRKLDSVGSIVGQFEKTAGNLAALAADKIDESQVLHDAADRTRAAADAAWEEGKKARAVAQKIADLIG